MYVRRRWQLAPRTAAQSSDTGTGTGYGRLACGSNLVEAGWRPERTRAGRGQQRGLLRGLGARDDMDTAHG